MEQEFEYGEEYNDDNLESTYEEEKNDEGEFNDEMEDLLEEAFDEQEFNINLGAEWREFEGDKSKSRVGAARELDIDEDLRTDIMGGGILAQKMKKMERMTRTPEDVFKIILTKTIKDHDLSNKYYNEALRVMQKINRQDKKLRFKNPKAIIFALIVLSESGKNINKKVLKNVVEEHGMKENINEIDLLRYIFFIEKLD